MSDDKPWYAFWRNRTPEESLAAIKRDEDKANVDDYARAARLVLNEQEAAKVAAAYKELRAFSGFDFGRLGGLTATIVAPVAFAIKLKQRCR